MARPLVPSEAISSRTFSQTGLYFELMRPFGIRDVTQLQRSARLRSQALAVDDRLKLRELTILARAACGETNAEIAGALFINPSTVRKHLEHIRRA
ncbi:MAG: LuxR C-terminal-related transcriptional regulator [Actinomycetota bacterium]|nr:LuxR C-terminal-related transcriptional regulator [Actinomycetota bacterium]